MRKNNKTRAEQLINNTFFSTALVNYLHFVKVRVRRSFPLNVNNIIKNSLYYAYTSLRRKSKMKVIAHFKDDGPTIQKVVEELLLECCTTN